MPLLGGLSMPFVDLRSDTLALHKQLEDALNRAEPVLYDVQLYARATVVFACMTIEAALNTYGLIRFGEAQFERHFAYDGPARRLCRLLRFGAGLELPLDHPMLAAVERVVKIRNAIVHIRSEESRFDESGVVRSSTKKTRNNWAGEVDGVLQDMDLFLTHFPDADPETRTFLLLRGMDPRH
jgi:hypothetical protein